MMRICCINHKIIICQTHYSRVIVKDNINKVTSQNDTIFHILCSRRRLEIIEYLIRYEPDMLEPMINKKNNQGHTGLSLLLNDTFSQKNTKKIIAALAEKFPTLISIFN